MKTLDLGDLHFEFDGSELHLSSAATGQLSPALDAQDIQKLSRFLGSLSDGQANQRQTFRLSSAVLMDLGVSLLANGRAVGATANDLSVTGISVQIHDDEKLDVPLMGEVEVVLELADETQSHTAILRRRDARGLGLFFPHSISGEHIEPPHELVSLILELQRRSLARLAGKV